MNEPRHDAIVSGEVIPPQTYLHKVAAAKREDPADDDAQENTTDDTAAADRDDTDSAGDVYDTYDAEDEEDDESPADTAAMPDTAPADTAPADTAPADTASDTAAADTAEPDTTRTGSPRAGILETDAELANATQLDSAATDSAKDAGRTGAAADAEDTAVMDTTRPDAITTAGSGAAEPREGRPGDVPIPADMSLIGDGAAIREQWMRVQASFVDSPRAAVTAAAGVITDAVAQVETAVRQRQQALRDRWDGDGHTDTEALRVTMQQYRQLLERLAAL